MAVQDGLHSVRMSKMVNIGAQDVEQELLRVIKEAKLSEINMAAPTDEWSAAVRSTSKETCRACGGWNRKAKCRRPFCNKCSEKLNYFL